MPCLSIELAASALPRLRQQLLEATRHAHLAGVTTRIWPGRRWWVWEEGHAAQRSSPGDAEALNASRTYAPVPSGIQATLGAGPRAIYTRISECALQNDILRCTKWGCADLASAESVHGQQHIVPCLSWTFPP